MLAIIGGSSLTRLVGLEGARRVSPTTQYGEPSSPLAFGRLGGKEVVFLARHGDGHTIAPHRINYRANVLALKAAGATEVVAVASVGGIRREFGPGVLVLPDQIIDYTWGRVSSFHHEEGAAVRHIDFTEPYTEALRQRVAGAARACGEAIQVGGVYGVTQGPRLESAAEIIRMERDGADLVGMTGMPEAALAREAELAYATIAVVANHAAGRGESAHAISLQAIDKVLGEAMLRVQRILAALPAA